MTSISMAKAGNDPAQNDDKSQEVTSLVHDTGKIVSASSVALDSAPEKAPIYQKMPQNTLSDYLTRATEIATYTIASTDVSVDVVATFSPWQLFLTNAKIAAKISSYKYVRGTIEVALVVAVPGNCYGSYVVSALPLAQADTLNVQAALSVLLTPENCMQVDHFARIDIAASENVILQLPFLWPYDYADLDTQLANMWSVSITCLSPIRTAIPGGVSTGNIKVFARLMEDYELVVPHLQGKHRHAQNLKPSPMTSMFNGPLHNKLEEAHKTKAVSGVADKVAGVADKLSGIPVIGTYAKAASTAAKTVSKVASWFGFTREDAEHNPSGVSLKAFSALSHFDGEDNSAKATFSVGNAISIDSTMNGGTSEDELAFVSLFNRWTLVDASTWTPDQTSGTVVTTIPITPSFCRSEAGPSSTLYHLTTAGFVGAPFQFWRGDMEYLIVIPVSKLHRGTLQVAWIPTGSSVDVNTTNSTLNVIYDISSCDEKQVTVGFARDKPFLYNNIMTSSTLQNYDWTNGRLALRIINPLSSQNNTADVQVFIFARACSNMQFAIPRTRGFLPEVDPITEVFEVAYALEGADGDEEDHQPQSEVLVDPSGDYPSDQLMFGECITSVRALMQKPYRVFPTSAGGTRPFFRIPILGMLPWPSILGSTDLVPTFTYAGWYRSMFACVATGERFKALSYLMTDQNVAGIERVFDRSAQPSTPPYTIVPGTLTPLLPFAGTYGYEGYVPYYTPRKFLNGYRNYAAKDTSSTFPFIPLTRLWSLNNGGVTGGDPTLWHSFAPDMRVSTFFQIPTLTSSGIIPGVDFEMAPLSDGA